MMNSDAPILVIGASGKVGSRIVRKLRAGGTAVRPASRRTTPSFDWEDSSTWAPTLAGAETVFVSFVPDLAAKGAPEAVALLAEKAVAAGVRRLVLLSGRGEANALRAEQIVRNSGLRSTIVRASWFFQNFSEGFFLPAILEGTVALPAGNVREPFIDVEDVADIAVAALLDPRHDGEIYEVTGPRLLSFADALGEISTAIGRPIRYAPISLDEFHAALLPLTGPDYAALMRDLCAEILDGRNESVTDGVERALGRPPRDFSPFVQAAAASGVWARARAAE